MEYTTVRGSRLTTFSKILIGSAIALILLIIVAVVLTTKTFYSPDTSENYKIAKADNNNKKNKGIKIKETDNKNPNIDNKDNVQEKAEVFIETVGDLGVEDVFNTKNLVVYPCIENNIDTAEEETNKQLELNNNGLNIDNDIPIIEEIKQPPKRDLTAFCGKKLVAFTFDDGPSNETTNRLLDNLDKYNARVTFFVVGSRINDNSETLKRAYDMGNQIGSHTYSHKNLFKLDNCQIMEEITTTNNEIKNIIGVEPTLLRPPYGNINCEIKNMINMYTILWDLDTEDWKNKDTNIIVDYILNNAHDGAIILLHDLYETSIDGALQAMELLEQQGYAFVTIDEMIELKNVELDKNISYHYFTD